MTEPQWTLAMIAAFVGCTLVFWRRARKDMFGAIIGGLLVVLICAVMIVVSGCTVSPERRPWLEAGIAWDREQNVGSNPGCIVRVRQPIGPKRRENWLIVGFEHHSSCPDQDDRDEINQLEIVAKVPLGRRR